MHLTTPFPEVESYQRAVARVAEWLEETMLAYAGRTAVVIRHRATFYALEYLIEGIPLLEIVGSPWQCQPGWTFRVTPGFSSQHPSPNR